MGSGVRWPSEKAYKMKAANCLRDLRYWVLKKAKERPKWLGNTIYEAMKKKSLEPAFLEKSEKAKKNRRGGSLSNPVEPSHFQGSISAAQHPKRMNCYAAFCIPIHSPLLSDSLISPLSSLLSHFLAPFLPSMATMLAQKSLHAIRSH
ncbi:hypothetical protein BVRB_2g046550 [Beta vulgaris subsp. vulgaris]|nr:hypothetical protein BVRB_2g046550 [Beta vulgaris subsp. vulgaris]